MRFGSRITSSFYGGAALSSLVPGVYHVSLNGRPYLLDLTGSGFKQRTVALLRQQADQSNVPGEASINPEDLWRRSMESWHHGAGQTNFDRPDSDPYRFNTSKGVNVWTKWRLSLLQDTSSVLASANTNLYGAAVGSRYYTLDGTALKYSTTLASWTAVTGTPATAGTSIATDGYNVWTAHGADGVYTTTRAGAAATQLVTTALDATAIVGYVKGRLMVAWKNAIYNITSTAAAVLPAALFTQSNTDFAWVGFAEGLSNVYAAGYSGDKSIIYRATIKTDGTALDAPVVAGELPDGEIVRSIRGYLGYLVIGTDLGVRFAATDTGGNLTIGALLPTTSPVRCMEPQDRFVWYGLENYDSTSTGLGRLDLTAFTQSLTPAYASDIMVTGQGHVISAATFLNKRVVAVAGSGVYTESANLVAVGQLDSGPVQYGITDDKTAMALDVAHEPLAFGSHAAYLSVDSGTFQFIGTHSVGDPESRFPCGQRAGEKFEVRLQVTRDDSDTTMGPTLTRATLFAEPVPPRSFLYTVPLLLNEIDQTATGERARDVIADLDDITACVELTQTVAFQIGKRSAAVFVKDFEFDRQRLTTRGDAWQGVCTVLLKEPAQ